MTVEINADLFVFARQLSQRTNRRASEIYALAISLADEVSIDDAKNLTSQVVDRCPADQSLSEFLSKEGLL